MKYMLEWELKQDYGRKWDPTLQGQEIEIGEFVHSGAAMDFVEKEYYGNMEDGEYERLGIEQKEVEDRHWDLHSTLWLVMKDDTQIAVANWARKRYGQTQGK